MSGLRSISSTPTFVQNSELMKKETSAPSKWFPAFPSSLCKGWSVQNIVSQTGSAIVSLACYIAALVTTCFASCFAKKPTKTTNTHSTRTHVTPPLTTSTPTSPTITEILHTPNEENATPDTQSKSAEVAKKSFLPGSPQGVRNNTAETEEEKERVQNTVAPQERSALAKNSPREQQDVTSSKSSPLQRQATQETPSSASENRTALSKTLLQTTKDKATSQKNYALVEIAQQDRLPIYYPNLSTVAYSVTFIALGALTIYSLTNAAEKETPVPTPLTEKISSEAANIIPNTYPAEAPKQVLNSGGSNDSPSLFGLNGLIGAVAFTILGTLGYRQYCLNRPDNSLLQNPIDERKAGGNSEDEKKNPPCVFPVNNKEYKQVPPKPFLIQNSRIQPPLVKKSLYRLNRLFKL